MGDKPTFGFVVTYVDDIEAARRFYEQVLGLEVLRESPVFIQYDHFAIASDEALSGQRVPEPYWLVDDARAARAGLPAGVEVMRELETLPFGTVFGVRDPSGNAAFLVELASNRPSQPVGKGGTAPG